MAKTEQSFRSRCMASCPNPDQAELEEGTRTSICFGTARISTTFFVATTALPSPAGKSADTAYARCWTASVHGCARAPAARQTCEHYRLSDTGMSILLALAPTAFCLRPEASQHRSIRKVRHGAPCWRRTRSRRSQQLGIPALPRFHKHHAVTARRTSTERKVRTFRRGCAARSLSRTPRVCTTRRLLVVQGASVKCMPTAFSATADVWAAERFLHYWAPGLTFTGLAHSYCALPPCTSWHAATAHDIMIMVL